MGTLKKIPPAAGNQNWGSSSYYSDKTFPFRFGDIPAKELASEKHGCELRKTSKSLTIDGRNSE